jgi:hypothetical protein
MYAIALTLFAFFVTWALVVANPWPGKPPGTSDPRLRALAAREQKLRRESIATQRLVQRRWAIYRRQLAARNSQIAGAAAAPRVRIVSAPAATATRSS